MSSHPQQRIDLILTQIIKDAVDEILALLKSAGILPVI